jgi:hypothetical protein
MDLVVTRYNHLRASKYNDHVTTKSSYLVATKLVRGQKIQQISYAWYKKWVFYCA